jgi:hypothetical protein
LPAEGWATAPCAKPTAFLIEVAKARQEEIEALKAAMADRDAREAELEALAARLAALEAREAAASGGASQQ